DEIQHVALDADVAQLGAIAILRALRTHHVPDQLVKLDRAFSDLAGRAAVGHQRERHLALEYDRRHIADLHAEITDETAPRHDDEGNAIGVDARPSRQRIAV